MQIIVHALHQRCYQGAELQAPMTMTGVHVVMHANMTWQTHTQRLLRVLNIHLTVNRLSIFDRPHDTKGQNVTHDERGNGQWQMATTEQLLI